MCDKYFDHFDLNKDGVITFEEMMKYHEKEWGADFATNKKRIVDSTSSDFKIFDANKDKKITREEMLNFWQELYTKDPNTLKMVEF